MKSLEKSPSNREEVESFLQRDSKKLEESVAHILAAYFVAGRAIEKMKEAEKKMPSGVKSDKVDLEKRKKNYNRIKKEVVKNLQSIDNDIKELDRHLKEVYHEKGGDKQLRAEINFIEALAQCIEEFLSTGDIRDGSPNSSLSDEIKTYIDEDIAEMNRKEREKMAKSRKHDDDRWKG